MNNRLLAIGLILAIIGFFYNTTSAQVHNTPSPIFNKIQSTIPSAGYMVAGDLWDTVNPMSSDYSNYLGSAFAPEGANNYIMLGSPGNWRSPTGIWPSTYPLVTTWRSSPAIMFPMFNANGWPGYDSSNPLYSLDGTDDSEGSGGTGRYMFAMFGDQVPGVDDPARNYSTPAQFTDQTRTKMVYEAGWPTTAGVDMKVRAIQYTPNTQNLNDFVVLEVSMTNTGVVDSNNDGTPEATGNDIDGIAMSYDALATIAVEIGQNGDRRTNRFGAGRTFGYIGSNDDEGNPYDIYTWFPNSPEGETSDQATPPPGSRHFGITNFANLWGYDDIWSGYSWLGVKEGAIQKGGPINDISASTPDKQTIFGTNPIGQGSRRGWYTSIQWQPALASTSRDNSELVFRNAIATWFEDYGKTTDGNSQPADLNPNSNFFSSGEPEDITTWVVGNPNVRPNGDFKLASKDLGNSTAFETPIWEQEWNPTAQEGGDFYNGTGFTKNYTFGEAMAPGVGPFSLDVGESMTFVWVYAAGYRMDGLTDAVEAARWAFDKGWDISTDLPVPAAPDIQVVSTAQSSAKINWTDVSNISSIDGYKIWRASQYKRTNYLDQGMRLVDRYQEQQDTTASIDQFLDPVNPLYDDTSIFQGDIQGSYQPAGWGTYELVATIPNSELGEYTDNSNGYSYSYEDTDAITGFTYWYYVSAYKDGNFMGPQGSVNSGHIESSNFNRNGRNSPDAPLATIGTEAPWSGTYPFSTQNPNFPELGTLAYKNIGTSFTVNPPAADPSEVEDLITVSPNPYKITGLNDVRNDASSHNINFLNLPENYTLTIIDVAGKIIFQTKVQGATNGKFTWDMFSKDGVEVASGVYIYHVKYDGGTTTGHFAILR